MLRIEYHRNLPDVGCHLLEQFFPLRRHFIRKKRDPSEVLTWLSKRHGKSRPDRAIANATDEGYATFTCLKQWLDNITADSEQNVGPLRDEFGGQFRKSIRHTVRIAEDDFDVAAVEETGLCECVLQRLIDWSQFLGSPNTNHPIRGSGFCALTASGQAATMPPRTAMNSRRCIRTRSFSSSQNLI